METNKFDQISRFFETEYPLNHEGLKELLALHISVFLPKGSLLQTTNQNLTHLRFLNKGIIREYYATADKETNINFYTKTQFITDLSAFNTNQPTKKIKRR